MYETRENSNLGNGYLVNILQPFLTVPGREVSVDYLAQSILQMLLQHVTCQTVGRTLVPKVLVMLEEDEAKFGVQTVSQAVEKTFDKVKKLQHLQAMPRISAYTA